MTILCLGSADCGQCHFHNISMAALETPENQLAAITPFRVVEVLDSELQSFFFIHSFSSMLLQSSIVDHATITLP